MRGGGLWGSDKASTASQLCDALLSPQGTSLILLPKEGVMIIVHVLIAWKVYKRGGMEFMLSISMIELCKLG